MNSDLDMGSNKITNVVDPTAAQEGATKNYIDSNFYDQSTTDNKYLHLDGSKSMNSNLNMGSNKITNVVDPTAAQQCATKNYVDNNITNNNSGNFYVADKEMFGVTVPDDFFKLFTHTLNFNNTGPHFIEAFIIFWGADSSPPNNTSISMQISDGSLTYHHPIQTFSTTYQPARPNIPADHPDTLYMRYATSFDNTNSIDVSLEVQNHTSSSQDYNIYFFSHVIEGKSSTNLP
jgi:hypothetical protein